MPYICHLTDCQAVIADYTLLNHIHCHLRVDCQAVMNDLILLNHIALHLSFDWLSSSHCWLYALKPYPLSSASWLSSSHWWPDTVEPHALSSVTWLPTCHRGLSTVEQYPLSSASWLSSKQSTHHPSISYLIWIRPPPWPSELWVWMVTIVIDDLCHIVPRVRHILKITPHVTCLTNGCKVCLLVVNGGGGQKFVIWCSDHFPSVHSFWGQTVWLSIQSAQEADMPRLCQQ